MPASLIASAATAAAEGIAHYVAAGQITEQQAADARALLARDPKAGVRAVRQMRGSIMRDRYAAQCATHRA